jgi:hypothetical protein
VCPDADLPDGQTATLTIDGFPFLSGVHSFRASCTIANHCTIVLADTDPDALLAASAWYQQAETGVPQARRDFTIRVVDAGATQGTYFVSNGIPSAFLVDADHWQLTLTSERLQPVRG